MVYKLTILNFIVLHLNKLLEVMKNIRDNPESVMDSINDAKCFILCSLKQFDFAFSLYYINKYLI